MANIVFMPFHWAADMNATFALARKLQHRGHRVYYATIPDTEERIRTQGFEWVPAFREVFPKGELARQDVAEAQGQAYGVDQLRNRVRGMCDLLRKGEINRATREIKPDLLVVSSGMPWLGIAAPSSGIPVVQFSSTLISVEDSSVPPFRTSLMPANSLSSRLKIAYTWKKLLLRRRLRNKAFDFSDELKQLARDCGFPVNKIDFLVETWPRPLLPELVFCPPEFDFPRRKMPACAFFVEASIDLERKEETTFPWSRLQQGKPIILCALGSLVTVRAASEAARFFQMLLDAISQRPSIQAVVAIGSALKSESFNCPENALLVPYVPQIELLMQCAAMVGHGGFSSVKEAIFMGVPMLLIPLAYDEPGNAARVVYHGLGLRLDREQVSPDTLGNSIDRLLNDGSFLANARRMSQKFIEVEQRSPACEIIEKMLAGQAP
ncbi:MAG TPA: glycosyltransferase [Candidatus Angelobacter sp.]|jgi:MGT family glycosyltransferase